MDPLEALQAAIARKQNIHYDEASGVCVIGDKTYPATADTTWRALKGKGDPYKIGATVLLWQMQHAPYAEYYNEASKRKIPAISIIDKKPILSHLSGTQPADATATGKHPLSAAPSSDEPSLKRPRADATPGAVKPKDVAAIPGMTVEKLTELRKKREALKAAGPAEEPTDILKEADVAVMKNVAKAERLLRTRESVLLSQTKDFSKSFDTIRQILKTSDKSAPAAGDKRKGDPLVEKKKTAIRYEKSKDTASSQKSAPASQPQKAAPAAAAPPSISESEFWRSKLKGNDPLDLDINVHGGFADSGLQLQPTTAAAATAPAPAARPSAPAPAPAASAPKPVAAARPRSSSTVSSSSTSAAKPSPAAEPKKAIPIIVLPTAVTALLTMINAKDFLEDGVFITPADKKTAGGKKDDSLVISRVKNKGEPPVRYLVIDNPTKLQPKDWHRVVAVFSSGHAWQFKGWKWTNPTDLFANARGFFLKYDDEKAPDLIKSWDVKVLNVSKTKRHLDPTSALAFWQELDSYIGHRSHLQQILRW